MNADDIKRLFVVGGGFMGSGIAQVAITAGMEVTLNDLNMEILERSKAGIEKQLEKRVQKGKLAAEDKDAIMSRLIISDKLEDAASADMIIEAAVENVGIKKDIFKKLDNIINPGTILASNTSSISIAELSSVVKNPKTFVGTHFFSPVPAMKLLEIVKGIGTASETVDLVKEIGENRWGKVCIVAKDRPCFIVNRMLDPMINEAISMLDEGIGTIESIDNGCRYGLNHPMGPLELIDMAGIDILLPVMEVLHRETGDPKYRPAPLLRDMVRMGWFGRKTGKGFYVYEADGTRYPNPDL